MNTLNHQDKSKGTNEEEGGEVVSPAAPARPAKVARQCEHIMINGEFCRAVALRGRKYCFFHLVHIGRRLRAERVHELALSNQFDPTLLPMELPLLEDANAIQLALSHVIDDVLHHRLDSKRAGLVLYALQTASGNLANGVDFSPKDGATVANRYDDFEEDYQLGETAPELRVEEDAGGESCEDPHKPKEGLYGAPEPEPVLPHTSKDGTDGAPASPARGSEMKRRIERDAPSQRLEIVPAAHMQGRKPPVFALVERKVVNEGS